VKIFLYIVDCLRADHVSAYGYHRSTTPHIDALGREGVLFKNAFTPSTWTRPSAASILTGYYPLTHGVETMNSYLPAEVPKLQKVLRENGYITAAFSTIPQVSREFGFADGFDHFHELFRDEGQSSKRPSHGEPVSPSSEDLNHAIFPWVEKNVDRDMFVFSWSVDVHVPYEIPEDRAIFRERGGKRYSSQDYKRATLPREDMEAMIDLYDSCIHYNDRQIGLLCDHLKKLGIYDEALIVISGDHGEIFNEHSEPRSTMGNALKRTKDMLRKPWKGARDYYGRRGHINVPPYDTLMKVPLVVKFPHARYCGRQVPNMVSLISLAPTIVQSAGLEGARQNDYDGRSLLENMDEKHPPGDERIYFSAKEIYPHHPSFYAVRDRKWKYILTEVPPFSWKQMKREGPSYLYSYLRMKYVLANRALYDVQDGAEKENVIGKAPEVAVRMGDMIKEWKTACMTKRQRYLHAENQVASMDEMHKKQLQNLGYF
jgi:arylsulfatase A-like enzyme